MFLRKIIPLIISFLAFAQVAEGQDLLRGNPTDFRADRLTDADIEKFIEQLKSMRLTVEEAELLAVQRGFPQSEIDKLKTRMEQLMLNQRTRDEKPAEIRERNNKEKRDNNGTPKDNERGATSEEKKKTEAKNEIDQRVFGAELFATASLTFEPDVRIATPVNYEVGPDDELQITVYGVQEASHNLKVNPEGSITIPYVGVVRVGGLTIEAATSKIRQTMGSTAYRSLASGRSKLSVNLTRIRSIRVTVIGSARPGTYTVSSLSTLFNVLYQAGGPSRHGSFREIELVRNNKVERKVDLYKFLLNGTLEDNIRLRDNDVVRIPTARTRVELAGEIKRPGYFEVLPSESIVDLIKFAQGFTDSAYKAAIKVIRLTDKERQVDDVSAEQYSTFKPKTGDLFEIGKILNRYANRVSIEGAVFRPGYFALTDSMRVSTLIRKADGLREDAFNIRGQIVRVKEDLTKEVIPFDIREALAGHPQHDIELKREDIVLIRSIFHLRDDYSIVIQGEVRYPGSFAYVDSLRLKDAIVMAGGFTDAAYPRRIEVSRIIQRDTLTKRDLRSSEIIEPSTGGNLAPGDDIVLRPFDVITVRRKPGYTPLLSVVVSGQVQYPGPYVISSRNEQVSDIIRRAGGFTPEAYLEGAYLKRRVNAEKTSDIKFKQIDKIQEQFKDTSLAEDLKRDWDQIPLDLARIIKNPGIAEDLQIQEGDEIFVPKFDAQVRVNGEVLFPTQVPYNPQDQLRDYISSAGGYTDNAAKRRVYVLYANGKAASTKNFLLFRVYPKIRPGSEIIVPDASSNVKQRRSPQENIALASAIASLAGVVIAIINLTR